MSIGFPSNAPQAPPPGDENEGPSGEEVSAAIAKRDGFSLDSVAAREAAVWRDLDANRRACPYLNEQ